MTALLNQVSNLPHRLRTDSLLRNSLFIMATQMVTSALGYVYWVVAAKSYPAKDVGLVSAVISAMTLTSMLCNLGFSTTLIQSLPRKASGHEWSITLNAALLVTSLVSLVGGVLVLGFFMLNDQFAEVVHSAPYMAAFLFGAPLWTATMLIDATFTGERQTNNMLIRNALFAVLKMLLLVALIPFNIGGLGVFLSWVLGTLVSILVSFSLIRRLGRDYKFTLYGFGKQTRSMFSSLIGNHFINIGGALPFYLLPVLVTTRLSAADNAYFYTTWMLGTLFAIISIAVAQSLLAEGSHAFQHLLRNMRTSFIIIVTLLIPVMFVFLFFGQYILALFGQSYAVHGLELLRILTIATLTDATTSVYISVLRVQKRLREAAFLNLFMAAIVLTFSWFTLPSLGIAAIGWGWLLAQSSGTVVVIIDFIVTRRRKLVDIWPDLAVGDQKAAQPL